jgi:hypothetical protein
MNVDISEKEYRDLLDVLHIAEWVMHAHEFEADPASAPYDRIIQKFFALAGDMGQKSLVEYNPDEKEYYYTRDFEENSPSWDFIDDFIENTFWDELIQRLTERDIARKVGGYEQLGNLSMKERFAHEGPIMERYSQEFDEQGLSRLEIVEHFNPVPPASSVTHD